MDRRSTSCRSTDDAKGAVGACESLRGHSAKRLATILRTAGNQGGGAGDVDPMEEVELLALICDSSSAVMRVGGSF
jgi:hypothetical protein